MQPKKWGIFSFLDFNYVLDVWVVWIGISDFNGPINGGKKWRKFKSVFENDASCLVVEKVKETET